MIESEKSPTTVEEYIQGFPKEVQEIMQKIRSIVKEEAPEIQEKISYGMPTFSFNGILVHFAAYKKHIGFYPTPSGISKFEEQLKNYKYAKGSVQFPLSKPIPYDLIRQIVKTRVKDNLNKAKS
ncbi:iron chaperone [Desemzia sp. RIT 804]|uniref:iron chaperone n=1 Tax=Desemzia sp. RIT 804 TaxID=2810209 RepID=UPI00351C150D